MVLKRDEDRLKETDLESEKIPDKSGTLSYERVVSVGAVADVAPDLALAIIMPCLVSVEKGTTPRLPLEVAKEYLDPACRHSVLAAFAGDNPHVVSNLVAPSDGLPRHTLKGACRLTESLSHPCTNVVGMG